MKVILLIVTLIFLGLSVNITTVSAAIITTPEGVIITHYPDKFDGVGTVYSVEKSGVVIDDMFIPFASKVRYMTPRSVYSSVKSFTPGQKVGYLLNEENQITKLCLFLGGTVN